MKPRTSLIGLGIIAASSIALWGYSAFRVHSTANLLAEPDVTPTAPSAASSASTALASTPEAEKLRQRQIFEKALRLYLREGSKLDAAQRSAQAQQLAIQINQREGNKELSAGEAMLLRIGLIRTAEPNEMAQAQQVDAMVKRYRQDAAQRQAAFLQQQQRDQQFQKYKARELQIVREVNALQAFPDGISREEYLRQRLQEAREAAYAAQPTTPQTPPVRP